MSLWQGGVDSNIPCLGGLVSRTAGQLDSWTAGQLVSWTAGHLDTWTAGQLDSNRTHSTSHENFNLYYLVKWKWALVMISIAKVGIIYILWPTPLSVPPDLHDLRVLSDWIQDSSSIFIFHPYIWVLSTSGWFVLCIYNSADLCTMMIRLITAGPHRHETGDWSIVGWSAIIRCILLQRVTHRETASCFAKICKVSRKEEWSLLHIKN